MLEQLILYSLIKRELTMYGIHKYVTETFGAYTKPSFGAVKPALSRFEKNGLIKTRKAMSEGGKLSVFYSITQDGLTRLKQKMLEPLSANPLNFYSCACAKLSCASFLPQDERAKLFSEIKSRALKHKYIAEKILDDNSQTDFFQKILLDSTICEFNNIIRVIEGLEKDNAG